MTKYYPANLVLENKICVVVGAGVVAARKVCRLLECGALVSVISPTIAPRLQRLAAKKKILFKNKEVELKDLSGAYLVIAATQDRKINAFVSACCRKKGILVNVVDSPQECNFILPAIVRRGSLTISISTDGISPALAKKIRQDLEKKFGAEYAKLLRILKEIRPEAIKKIKSARARNDFFQKLLQPGILALLKRNKENLAKIRIGKYFRNA
jgi:precorrin-2 dehydrogenase/sirohydrochlorin ferrochelatase